MGECPDATAVRLVVERGPGGLDGGVDILRRHAVVGHGTHLPVGIFHHLDVSRSERRQEGRPLALDAEQHEVRAHARGIERSGARLGRPARRNDAVHPGQPVGHGGRWRGPRPGGGSSRPVHRTGRPARRRPGSRLAHPATDHLPGATRAPDDVPPTDDQRADRAGQPLGQAERDRVGRVGEVGRAQSLGDDRVPEAGAVDVERDAVGVGDVGHLAGIGRGQWLAHRVGVGVLDGHQAADRFVRVGRVTEDAAISRGSTVPSGRSSRARTLAPTMTACPAASSMTRWCSRPAIVSGRARGGPSGRPGCPSSPTRRTGRLPCRAARPRAPRGR